MPFYRRVILWVVLLVSLTFMAGCETTKGTANCAGPLAAGTKDAPKSASKDTIWQGILKADNWIKENLW